MDQAATLAESQESPCCGVTVVITQEQSADTNLLIDMKSLLRHPVISCEKAGGVVDILLQLISEEHGIFRTSLNLNQS